MKIRTKTAVVHAMHLQTLNTPACITFYLPLLSLVGNNYFIPLVFVMSVFQVFLGRPRDPLPSIFPSISCICDVLCLIKCVLDIVVSSS